MHVNTLFHHALKSAGAWDAFATLDWRTRHQLLSALSVHAQRVLIEADGLPETARTEIAALTGSPLLGDLAGRCLAKWAGRAS